MIASATRSSDSEVVMSTARPPRLSTARMYERVLAGDATCNGRFFTGVLTTGIYCLPSCKARKPKRENVRFFPTCDAARAAGLRACKKCHPDDFAQGADPVLEIIERLVTEIRKQPSAFRDARAIIKRSGFGATRAFELFRQHFHTTPADLLLRARLDLTKQRLLTTNQTLAAIAFDVGFESLSVLHENFRALNGLTPAAYRIFRDPTVRRFTLQLPAGFHLGYLRRALSRDASSVTERLSGDIYQTGVQLRDGPALLCLKLSATEIGVEFTPPEPSRSTTNEADASLPMAADVHAKVVGLLGLDQDAAAFARLARKLGLGRLVAGREELRISRTLSVFDGLLWSIIGQQINFAFACVLKRRLTESAGTLLDCGLYAGPTPAAVAAMSAEELLELKFSRQKASYVISAAKRVASGELDLEALGEMSATRAERTLLALHGLGPWSVNYLMMRSLGRPDCVPLGDTGVTSGLQSLLDLDQRPDVDATRRLMAVFAPYRSLATAHLWQFNQPMPS